MYAIVTDITPTRATVAHVGEADAVIAELEAVTGQVAVYWVSSSTEIGDRIHIGGVRPVGPDQLGLQAELLADGWTVIDLRGGRAWPSDEVASLIEASDDPEGTAVQLCHERASGWRWVA